MNKAKCKECNKEYDTRDVFTSGYKEYCYECGYNKAMEDYKVSEQDRFEAELTKELPNFSDFDYDDIEEYI